MFEVSRIFCFSKKALNLQTAVLHGLEYFFHCFSEKIRLDISCEFSARQKINTKYQALFSSKDDNKLDMCPKDTDVPA